MANALYSKAREALAAARIDWVNDTIMAVLVDEALYTPNLAADASLAAIPAGARVATVALTGKANVLGVCSAGAPTFSGINGAPTIESLVLYKHTGTESTSVLIARIDDAEDEDGAALFPIPAGATQVSFAWDAAGIFRI